MGVSPDGIALLTHLLAALAGGCLLLALQVRPYSPYRPYRGVWGGGHVPFGGPVGATPPATLIGAPHVSCGVYTACLGVL